MGLKESLALISLTSFFVKIELFQSEEYLIVDLRHLQADVVVSVQRALHLCVHPYVLTHYPLKVSCRPRWLLRH